MTEQQQLGNEEVFNKAKEENLKALERGDYEAAKQCSEIMQNCAHSQNESEKNATEWNATYMKNENEQARLAQEKKQFLIQTGVVLAATGAFAAIGTWLECGAQRIITIPMLKTAMKKLEDTALRSFRH